MNDLLKQLSDLTSLDPATTTKILASLLVIIVLAILRLIALRIVYRRTEDIRNRYNWRKGITYIVVIIGLLVLFRLWFTGFHSVVTYLGLLSAGLAIALKDPLVNFVAWIFIIWRRPFTVGDRVAVGTTAGDVIDLRIFQFTLLEIGNWVDADQSTGRIIRVPNGKVFTENIANYSKGFQFIWNEIPVLVTYESNWKKAKEILTEIAFKRAEHLTEHAAQQIKAASAQMMVFYRTLTPIVYTSVKESGILLTVRYLCKPRERRGTSQEIWEDVLTRFGECDDIDFAYPTVRRYDNPIEGKPGARADLSGDSKNGPDETRS